MVKGLLTIHLRFIFFEFPVESFTQTVTRVFFRENAQFCPDCTQIFQFLSASGTIGYMRLDILRRALV
jgi:hypothetical protein